MINIMLFFNDNGKNVIVLLKFDLAPCPFVNILFQDGHPHKSNKITSDYYCLKNDVNGVEIVCDPFCLPLVFYDMTLFGWPCYC